MAGDVKVKVGADTTQLTTGLKTASASVDAFSTKTNVAGSTMGKLKTAMTSASVTGEKAFNGLKSSATALMAALGTFVGLKNLAEQAGLIDDLSLRFGESAESIQRLKYAADNSGTSVETLAKAMNKAELAATAAAQGNTAMQEAFDDLGISAAEFAGMSIEERVAALGDAYANSSNKAETFAAMTRIMGKQTTDLIPLFGQGGDAIRKLMGDAVVASSDAIGQIAELEDQLRNTWTSLKTMGMSAIGALITKVQEWGVVIAAVGAYVSELGSTWSLTSAKMAYEDTLIGGVEWMDSQKTRRETRTNKITTEEIEDIAAKKEAEDLEKELTKEAEKQAKEAEKAAEAAKKEAEAAERKLAANTETSKLDALKSKEDAAKGVLDDARGMEGGLVQADALRRIGGGFANSNYGQLSREAMLISKQVDYASRQLDELKKIVTELRKSDPLGGVTS